MSSPTALRRVAATAVAAASLAAVTVTGPQAGAAPRNPACPIGSVALTNQTTWVRNALGLTTVIYIMQAGEGFRVVGGPSYADGIVWMYGHGNGKADGWVPTDNLTCQ